ncbi:hypothetical protein OSB04_020649 [Centaurea solstitialis]|uniref:Uncharacterized protein n=1 Tax=Centaurea solstitialis TaxID=347529 RepID=A0AA38WH15_9ASTR|nr:hypothetical protein OSB04_020649 [Centaurea solstitialis]
MAQNRRKPPNDPPIHIFILLIFFLISFFFFLLSPSSHTPEIIKPKPAKSNWNSFLVFLFLFAVIAGLFIFAQTNEEVPRQQPNATTTTDPMILVFFLVILFFVFFFFVFPNIPDVIRPKFVKTKLDSFIIFLLILAIIAILLAQTNDVPSTPTANANATNQVYNPPSQSYTDWYRKVEVDVDLESSSSSSSSDTDVPSTPNATNPVESYPDRDQKVQVDADLRRGRGSASISDTSGSGSGSDSDSDSSSDTDSRQREPANGDKQLRSSNDTGVGKQNSSKVNDVPSTPRPKATNQVNNPPSESYNRKVQVDADLRRGSGSSDSSSNSDTDENGKDQLRSSNDIGVGKRNSSKVNDNLSPKEDRKENMYRSEPAADNVRHRPYPAWNVYSREQESIDSVPESNLLQRQSTNQVRTTKPPARAPTSASALAPAPLVATESSSQGSPRTAGVDENFQVTNQIDRLLDGSHVPPPAVASAPPIDETEEFTSKINSILDTLLDGSHAPPPVASATNQVNNPPLEIFNRKVQVDADLRRGSGNGNGSGGGSNSSSDIDEDDIGVWIRKFYGLNDNIQRKEGRKEKMYGSEPAADDVRQRPQREAENVYSRVEESIESVPESNLQRQSTNQAPARVQAPAVAPTPPVAVEPNTQGAWVDEIVQVRNQIDRLLVGLLDGSQVLPPRPVAAPAPPTDVESSTRRTEGFTSQIYRLHNQINRLPNDGSHTPPPVAAVESSGTVPPDETEQVTNQINRLNVGSDIPSSSPPSARKRKHGRETGEADDEMDSPDDRRRRNGRNRQKLRDTPPTLDRFLNLFRRDGDRDRDRDGDRKDKDRKGKGKAPSDPPNFFDNLFRHGGKANQSASSSSAAAAASSSSAAAAKPAVQPLSPPLQPLAEQLAALLIAALINQKSKGRTPPIQPPFPPSQPESELHKKSKGKIPIQPLSPPLQPISERLAAAMNQKSKGKTPPIQPPFPQPKSESLSQRPASTVKPPLPTTSSNYGVGDRAAFLSRDSSSSSSSSSVLLPPPRLPFPIPPPRIESHGDYLVRIRSLHDSDFGSDDRDHLQSTKFDSGDSFGPRPRSPPSPTDGGYSFGPNPRSPLSPDENARAIRFIFRQRNEWKAEKNRKK